MWCRLKGDNTVLTLRDRGFILNPLVGTYMYQPKQFPQQPPELCYIDLYVYVGILNNTRLHTPLLEKCACVGRWRTFL